LQELKEPEQKKRDPNTQLPIWGDSSTFNMNEVLRQNILQCQYFKDLFNIRTYTDTAEEITKRATHAEPWVSAASNIPSTLFCCLYKLMMMRLSDVQIKGLLEYRGCSYVRCVGFLYLRYCCNPDHLWDWFSKYLLDDEEIHPSMDPNIVLTIGTFAENLLIEQNYYNTRFPRIPLMIERELKKRLIVMSDKRKRKQFNIEMMHLFNKGTKVRAFSSEDDQWHDAIIERIEGNRTVRVKFLDTRSNEADSTMLTLEMLNEKFKGHQIFFGGHEEILNLGEIELPEMGLTHEEIKNENLEEIQQNMEIEEDKGTNNKDLKERKNESKSKSRSRSSRSRSSSKKRRDHKSHKDKKYRSKKSRSRSRDRETKRRKRKHSYSSSSSSSNSRSRSRDKKKNDRDRTQEPKEKQPQKQKRSIEKEKEKVKEKTLDPLMEEVLRREKEKVLATNKAEYAQRPLSYKSALSSTIIGGPKKAAARSPSPKKRVVVIKQQGEKRHKEEEKHEKKEA